MRTIPILAALIGMAGSLSGSAQPFDIGGRKQLFIDRRFIAEGEGVTLEAHPPEKCGLVIRGENTWENGFLSDASAVIEDGGKFRLWYTACAASGPELAVFKLCYAESNDGLHWTKPNLGLYEWQGSKANNIIMDSNIENGAGVFLDPHAPPSQRYKLLARLASKKVLARGQDPQVGNAPNGPGMYIYTSPDGLHWQLQPTRLFPFSPDTANMALYDGRTGKYLAYLRVWNPLRRVGVVETADIMQPWPYDHSAAPRLWPNRPNDNPAPSREIPEAFGPEADNPANVDFYTAAVVRYPWADDAYFMFPSAYRHFPEPPASKYRNDGLVDIQMAVSRDGRKFHRVSHFPYIELGLPGSGEEGSMYMGIGMLRRGDQVYQYYGGYNFSHGSYLGLPEVRDRGGIRLARQRLDGFVSADAGEAGGRFVTPVLRFAGSRLALNQDASAAGDIEVELRHADGSVIPGYSFADSDVLGGNNVATVATWRIGHSDVGALSGQPIRIAFRMRCAKLYAFQFEE